MQSQREPGWQLNKQYLVPALNITKLTANESSCVVHCFTPNVDEPIDRFGDDPLKQNNLRSSG